MRRFLTLIGTATLIGLAQIAAPHPRDPAAPDQPTPQKTPPKAARPGWGETIDRMATRFGATAIIIVAWFPLAQLAPELHKAAWVYALPEVTSQIWVVWVLLVLAVVMTPLALASMLSVIAPLYRYLEGSKGIWKIAASAVALALTVCAYAALLVVIAMGTEFSDEATKLARQLSVQDQACADPPLHGQVCEDAINALLAK